ncbi:MAG: hypothetical protein FJ267_05120, partial [Planctomycetes bacterium]|nr:hypothetical protein [Planctomycetota bacterium]
LYSFGLGLFVTLVMAMAIGLSRPDATPQISANSLNANGSLKWYRGNLHTHSHWSDGDDYLEMIALWYREHQYDFLGFTDHNTLADKEKWVEVEKTRGGKVAYDKLKARFPNDWIDERMIDNRHEIRLKRFDEIADKFSEKDKFLLIQGEEISDLFGKSPIHLNASNLVAAIPPLGGTSVTDAIQNNVDALMSQRQRSGRPMMIHLNHPNYKWGITAEDLAPVRGENFFEVYNGHPGVNNPGDDTHASTERIWDIINSKRLTELDLPLLYGLATDDGHSYHKIPSRASEPGRGWVMVLTDQLDPGSLITAMESGRFYASSGVTLEKISTSTKSLDITVKADPNATYTIEFIGTRKGFNPKSEPILDKDGKELPVTRKYSDEIGSLLQKVDGTTGSYEFRGDELYVRARITSSKPHPNPSTLGEPERAWTQPVRP